MSRPLSILAAACTALALPAQADEHGVQIQQSYRLALWSHTRDLPDEHAVATAQAWYRFTGDLSDEFSFAGEVWGDLNLAEGHGLQFTVEPREAYVQWRSGAWRVRGGRQIFAWGRSDRINPTDVASSRDLTALVSTDEEERRGEAAIRIDFEIGDGYVTQAYWIPEFRPDRFGDPVVDRSDASEFSWSDQAGLRLERTGGDIDWSVTLYRGPNHRPQLAPTGAGVANSYPMRTMLGVDAATSFGDTTLRGEIAHYWSENRVSVRTSSGQDWFAVIGVDHEFTSNVYGNAQLLYAHSRDQALCDLSCSLAEASLVAVNNILAMTIREAELGASMMLAYQDDYQTQRYEVSAIHLSQDDSTLLRGRAKINLSDENRVEFGGDVYFGNAQSVLGAQENRSAAFVAFVHGY